MLKVMLAGAVAAGALVSVLAPEVAPRSGTVFGGG